MKAGRGQGFLVWFKSHRRGIFLGLLAISILAVYFTDVWLGTCGFDGCPTPRDIQTFQPDQGGRILDRNNRLMGRLELVRRVNVSLKSVPDFVQYAFIATEDRRFFKHGGLDWRGFFRALATSGLMIEREAFAARQVYADGVYSSATWPANQPM